MVLGFFAIFNLRKGDTLLFWFDVASYAGVFAAIVARTGCFLAHDHLGSRTSSWISVKCSDGPRYDLALFEVIFLSILAILLVRIGTRSRGWTDGVVFGIIALSYGSLRFALEWFREIAARHFGLTVEQYAALILVGCSLFAFRGHARTRLSTS
jgi:prolipoprotein diacylglyceryltransferase